MSQRSCSFCHQSKPASHQSSCLAQPMACLLQHNYSCTVCMSGHVLFCVFAAYSGLEELWWHQGMLQRWPEGLCSAYALAILVTAGHWLQSLQLAPVSPNTTMQQLCQSIGNAAQVMDLASSVHQTSMQMQQTEEARAYPPDEVLHCSKCSTASREVQQCASWQLLCSKALRSVISKLFYTHICSQPHEIVSG